MRVRVLVIVVLWPSENGTIVATVLLAFALAAWRFIFARPVFTLLRWSDGPACLPPEFLPSF